MERYILCHACDLVHVKSVVREGERAHCARCRAELYRGGESNLDVPLALSLVAFVLLLLTNTFPLVALKINGIERVATLVGAAQGLYEQGFAPMALLLLLTTVVIPFAQVIAVVYLLLSLRASHRPPLQNMLIKFVTALRPWGMVEVFMLGSLVALVKLAAFAQVVPGVGLFACLSSMIALAVVSSRTTREELWRWAR